MHGGALVGLVVDEFGDEGGEAAGDELADEDDASAALAGGLADVGAEVDLGEVGAAWDGDAFDAAVEEVEGDEADEGLVVEGVGFETFGEEGEAGGVDVPGDECKVSPLGGEEGAGHVGGYEDHPLPQRHRDAKGDTSGRRGSRGAIVSAF